MSINPRDEYENILNQTESDDTLPDDIKKSLINMLNQNIRGYDLVQRFSDYFDNGYYLGYFLIQSQRIEATVATILEGAEKVNALKENREPKKLDLNKPLGSLISELKKYIKSDEIFLLLDEFNKYRRVIIHRLYSDFSRDLSDIENSILEDYSPSKINDLQTKLLEILRRISLIIFEKTKTEGEIPTLISDSLEEILGQSSLEVELL